MVLATEPCFINVIKTYFTDSGIATSPANTVTFSDQPVRGGGFSTNGIDMKTPSTNLVLELGISERGGANLMKQRTLSSENEGELASGYAPPTYQLEQMSLKDRENFLAAKNKMRAKRIRTQSHSDWSTTIAPRYQCEDGECSVQSCLNNFTAVELMTGNNKVGCDGCTKRINGEKGKTIYTNATKQFLISSPPAVLILHLKRFQVSFHLYWTSLLITSGFNSGGTAWLPKIDSCCNVPYGPGHCPILRIKS